MTEPPLVPPRLLAPWIAAAVLTFVASLALLLHTGGSGYGESSEIAHPMIRSTSRGVLLFAAGVPLALLARQHRARRMDVRAAGDGG